MVKYAAESGHTLILILTEDSDIVVISISLFPQIQDIDELWIESGCRKYRKSIPIHDICAKLSPEICTNLLAFQPVTDCDTVSTFYAFSRRQLGSFGCDFVKIMVYSIRSVQAPLILMMNVMIYCSDLLFYFMIRYQILGASMAAEEFYLHERIEYSKTYLLQQIL